MSKRRSQRYRLTFDFVLEDRSDYANIRSHLQAVLSDEALSRKVFHRIATDWLEIAKVNDA